MNIITNIKNSLAKGALLLGMVAVSASIASAADTPVDYGATLSTNLSSINTIWGSVATIMIAVALVTVGTRFFKKAK